MNADANPFACEPGYGANPRHPWTEPDFPYRVYYYDPKRRGTWHRYFKTLAEAQTFASTRRIHAHACVVETSPRLALEAR